MSRYGSRSRPDTVVSTWLPSGEFSPLRFAPKAWYDASDTSTITQSGGAVSQWNDLSGNGLHMSQGTAAAQPTTGTQTINALNVLRFDGNDILAGATASDWTFITAGSISIFIVCRQTGTNSNFRPILANKREGVGDRGIQFAMDRANNLGICQTYNGSAFMYSSACSRIAQNKASLVAVVADMTAATADRCKVFVDRVQTQTDNSGTGATSATTPTYALRVGGEPTLYFFTGDIAELVIFDRAVTASEQQQMNTYLASKWGL